MLHRSSTFYPIILIFLSVLLWLPRLRGPLDLRYDAGVYYILGSSLAEGKGYRLLNEPGEIEAIQYPPVLPLIAAGCQLLVKSTESGVAGRWLRYFFAVLFIGYIVGVYGVSRRYLGSGLAFLSALVVLLHVHTTWLSDLFFAELPFAFTSILFLFVVGGKAEGRRKECLAWGLGALCFLLRTSGIALLAAWVGESLLSRRFRVTLIRLALAVIPVIAWQGYIGHVKAKPTYRHPYYPYQRSGYQYYNVGYLENLTYIDPFVPELGKMSPQQLAKRIALNFASMPVQWGEAISSRAEWSRSQIERFNKEISPISVPIRIVDLVLGFFGVVVLVGLLRLAFQGERVIPLYVAASVGLISLTPWPGQFERYVAPLTPLFVIAFFLAILAALKWLRTKDQWRRWLPAAVLAVMAALGIFGQEAFALYKVYTKQHRRAFYEDGEGRRREYRLFFYTKAWQHQDAALDWLKGRAKTEEIVATSTPHWVYLKTGLRAVMPPFEVDVRKAQRLIDSVPVNYLIVDDLEEFVNITRRYAAPLVREFPGYWALVYAPEKGSSQIYQRVISEENRGSR